MLPLEHRAKPCVEVRWMCLSSRCVEVLDRSLLARVAAKGCGQGSVQRCWKDLILVFFVKL